MSDAIERLKTYEEGLRDGFIKGQEEANKVMEQMLHATCNPVVCDLPETEAIKLLKERIKELEKSNENLANQSMILCQRNVELEILVQKLKCCENCKHHSFWGDELKCNLMSYDDEFECLKTKSKWELWEKEQ
ncbi:hypothetical protein SAMN04487977_101502 [Treponema bryantii]|uniref:Uncharacterized protein n=1 Tax=Treponema bryantii TaxID=163 RepID=A0A1H9AWV4_9SPIR|nr:hypothetical protein [Treponema bryantii]SEP81282.1 hypothetical protein SAMN04487977_101502 [Treponema bryantii]